MNTQSNGAAPTGAVQFLNGSTPISGPVSYSGATGSVAGAAQLDASLSMVPSATATITAVYEGDSNYSGSTSGSQTLTLVPGFTLSVDPTSIIISAPGLSGSSSVTAASGGGFNGMIAFSCQAPATMKEAVCSVSPPAVTISGQSKLTITTTAPQTVAGLRRTPDWFLGCGAIICLLLLGIQVTRRRFHWAFAAFFFVLLVAAFAGCGGGDHTGAPYVGVPDPGTPPGTYVVTVTATSGSISRRGNVSVTLQ